MENKRGSKRKKIVTQKNTDRGGKQPKLDVSLQENDPINLKGGDLLCLGEGAFGQLGLGEDIDSRKKPAVVKTNLTKPIIKVSCGGMHTVCLTNEYKVYSFGCNDEGALGRDTSEEGSEFEPNIVEGTLVGKKVVDITTGDSHTAALTNDGEVYIWGSFRDSHGKLGLIETYKSSNTPNKLNVKVKVKKIASGENHLVYISENGQIFTMGCGEQGQLGRIGRYFTSRSVRRQIKDENNNEIEPSKDDQVEMACLEPSIVRIPKIRGISRNQKFKAIYAGSYSTFAVLETGHVFAFGLNNFNQLGVPDDSVDSHFMPVLVPLLSSRSWKDIAIGQHHAILLENETNHVYVLGRGEYGRLGLGEEVLQADEPLHIASIENASSVSANGCVSYAVLQDGSAYAWGMGTNLQLTTGVEDDVWVPIKMTGKQLETRSIISICAGGQHTALIACNKE